MATTKPEKRYPKPKQPLRLLAYQIVQSKRFDLFMIVIILLNMGTMFLTHQDQGPAWSTALSGCNVAFTGIFVLEMTLKLMAIGPNAYFHVSASYSLFGEQECT